MFLCCCSYKVLQISSLRLVYSDWPIPFSDSADTAKVFALMCACLRDAKHWSKRKVLIQQVTCWILAL